MQQKSILACWSVLKDFLLFKNIYIQAMILKHVGTEIIGQYSYYIYGI
jgi:hypothetical protein